jgi:hypothetical protein
MRIFVMSLPKFPTPPEQMPALIQGFVAWREKYRPVMESFDFFAGGGGGYGVVNVPDETTLNQLMLEYPLGPLSELDIRPVIDGDKALAQWQAAMQAMMGGA